MASFTGTKKNETITPTLVSPSVTATGASAPGIGADTIHGGGGDDVIAGGGGNDIAFLGDGDDRYLWVPGDASDVVNGQAGIDLLDFFASGASEKISLSANGARARLDRDVAAVSMDLAGVENLVIHAL